MQIFPFTNENERANKQTRKKKKNMLDGFCKVEFKLETKES